MSARKQHQGLTFAVTKPLLTKLLHGHPWIYKSHLPPELQAKAKLGDILTLLTPNHNILGYALYDDDSPIALRVLSLSPKEPPGPALWHTRFSHAHKLRARFLDSETTNAFRLFNGEGDGLPGITVDAYADFLALKLATPAWLPHLGAVVETLQRLVSPRGIYFKGLPRNRAAATPPASVLSGEAPPDKLLVLEHGMRLLVDIKRGQKTGLFLDQRENRRLIRQMTQDLTVLNLFSYNGGFSVAAALGGARHITSVDIAESALQDARDIFQANNISPQHHAFVSADVFKFLEDPSHKAAFDLVIVDPPSFAPNEKSVHAAVSAYTDLFARALTCVTPGGFIAFSSCSSHIPMSAFREIIQAAAAAAKQRLRLLASTQEPADHPVLLAFPEGHYLKFVLAALT